MNMDKERFKGLCLEILLLINGIMEAVKRNGYETMASLTMQGDDFFFFSVHDTSWSMAKVDNGPVIIRYEYEDEIQIAHTES